MIKRKEIRKESQNLNCFLYWNFNGVMSYNKLEQVAKLINEQDIDICLIDETHLVQGNIEDLMCLEPHYV